MSGETTGRTLDGLGLRLRLPAGWSGRIYAHRYPDPSPFAIAQAANFPLPPDDDDAGSKARRVMGEDSLLLVLAELDAAWAPREAEPGPLRITRRDFSGFEGVPSDHSAARVYLRRGARVFALTAEFGSPAPDDALLERANGVLATLAVGSRAELPPVPSLSRQVTVAASAITRVPFTVLASAGEASVSFTAPPHADLRVLFRTADGVLAGTVDSTRIGRDCERGERLACGTLLDVDGHTGERWVAEIVNRSTSPVEVRLQMLFAPENPPPLFAVP